MASSDCTALPVKNQAYRVMFPIIDADGDLVTGATGLDSEISKDQGTFADCTNEATEIATSSGIYYLDLTSTEMNADGVAIIVKTSSSGAKTTVITLYPQEGADIKVAVTHWVATAVATPTVNGVPEVDITHWNGTAIAGVDTAGYPKVTIKSGTGTGEIATTSGKVNGVILTDTLTTYTGNTVQTGDSYARIGATGSGLTTLATAANLSTANTGIADIQTRIPAALTGAGNIKAETKVIAAAAIDAASIAAAAGSKIADITIRRTFANAAASSDGDTKTGRSLLGAIAKATNKWSISGATLTVYESDDSTSLFTQTVTTTAGNPITALDTV